MATQIRLRLDGSADWTAANPTLGLGEIGLSDLTVGEFAIGTGFAAYTSLPVLRFPFRQVPLSLVDSKGDLLTGALNLFFGPNPFQYALPVGVDGSILVADSSVSSGMKYVEAEVQRTFTSGSFSGSPYILTDSDSQATLYFDDSGTIVISEPSSFPVGSSCWAVTEGAELSLNESGSVDVFNVLHLFGQFELAEIIKIRDQSFFNAEYIVNTPLDGSSIALAMGGLTSGNTYTDYYYIDFDGRTGTWGSLDTFYWRGGCSSAIRCFAFGGSTNVTGTSPYNLSEYTTFATGGQAQLFQRPSADSVFGTACSNSTRALYNHGGISTNNPIETVDFFQMTIEDFGARFGDLNKGRLGGAAAANSTTAIFGFGKESNPSKDFSRMFFATLGNATAFGGLGLRDLMGVAACSNSTHAVFAAGHNGSETGTHYSEVDRIEFASGSVNTSWSDLSFNYAWRAAASSETAATFSGGAGEDDFVDKIATSKIDRLFFATTGNASNMGELDHSHAGHASGSNTHGGLS